MKKGYYIYSCDLQEDEVNLSKEILKDVNFEDLSELKSVVTKRILKLPIEEQAHVINYIVQFYYPLYGCKTRIERNVEQFLAQTCFNDVRSIILSIVDDNDKDLQLKTISELEEKFGIKIINSDEEK